MLARLRATAATTSYNEAQRALRAALDTPSHGRASLHDLETAVLEAWRALNAALFELGRPEAPFPEIIPIARGGALLRAARARDQSCTVVIPASTLAGSRPAPRYTVTVGASVIGASDASPSHAPATASIALARERVRAATDALSSAEGRRARAFTLLDRAHSRKEHRAQIDALTHDLADRRRAVAEARASLSHADACLQALLYPEPDAGAGRPHPKRARSPVRASSADLDSGERGTAARHLGPAPAAPRASASSPVHDGGTPTLPYDKAAYDRLMDFEDSDESTEGGAPAGTVDDADTLGQRSRGRVLPASPAPVSLWARIRSWPRRLAAALARPGPLLEFGGPTGLPPDDADPPRGSPHGGSPPGRDSSRSTSPRGSSPSVSSSPSSQSFVRGSSRSTSPRGSSSSV